MTDKKGAIAVIRYNDLVLVGKKLSNINHFLAGMWHIPGETLEPGETYFDALHRGMKEETDLEITIGKYIGTIVSPTHKAIRWYECFSETLKTTPGSDLEAIKWIPRTDVLTTCGGIKYWSREIVNYFS